MKNKEGLQQHFLNPKNNELKQKILNKLKNLNYKNVVELGAGKGDFTALFKDCGHKIIAYEIDPTLQEEFKINAPNATFIQKDIKDIDKIDKQDILISAPPYDLLPMIAEKFIDDNRKYILMVPKKYFELFKDYEIIYVLEGEEFNPPSRGEHYVITNMINN